MLRKDKVAQAVSGAIAQDTGRWFNFGEELVVPKEQVATLIPAIAKNLRSYLAEEALVRQILARLPDKPTLLLHYEGVLEDPDAVIRQVVAFLKPGLASLPPEDTKMPLTERPSGPTAARMRAEFLAYITNSPAA
jgi:LPS sulfotransferase NodH